MTVRPVLFSAPMVRAFLEGRKTQTRRVLTKLRRFGMVREFGPSDTPGYDWHFRDKDARWHDLHHAELLSYLPFTVGDHLYVREAWRTEDWLDSVRPKDLPQNVALRYEADPIDTDDLGLATGKFRQSMHMPRWASRFTLIVTDVRVQRLQEISREDAIAEGLALASNHIEEFWRWPEPHNEGLWLSPVAAYQWLWNSLNADRGFGSEANPWVVAVSFTVRRANVDQLEVAA